MGSLLECMKPVCLFGNNDRQKEHERSQRNVMQKNHTGSLLECMKPVCLFGNNDRKKEHERSQRNVMQKHEKKERLLKNDRLTLQDCILSSPSSSTLSITSNKRVYPNPLNADDGAAIERLLLERRLGGRQEDENDDYDKEDMKTEGDSLSRVGKAKKRVSFRMPEVADVFILADSSKTTYEFD